MGLSASQFAGSGAYLRAEQIGNHQVPVTIESVRSQAFPDDPHNPKLVVSFVGKDAARVMNAGNVQAMIEAFGDDTDGWIGRRVVLWTERTNYQNKLGIKMRAADPAPASQQHQQPPPPQPQQHQQPPPPQPQQHQQPPPQQGYTEQAAPPLDDEIPF